ncbi:hypothetical protein CALCODRAFT_488845 [Calocera cornea HHB12733]|uniref:Uncharacterized protein n=1 Tax=Calocera cornea HHB12733 TaxID=1353952 RepID=A0A165C5F4_9BASI|nr:hypothetical protein CALCODRAFT_488845 [Calocera cornea HHB12733]
MAIWMTAVNSGQTDVARPAPGSYPTNVVVEEEEDEPLISQPNLPPASEPECQPASAPANASPHEVNWDPIVPDDEMRSTEAGLFFAQKVDRLYAIAAPARDDPGFKHFRIEPNGSVQPSASQLVNLLKEQTVILFTGGESWEDKPFSLKTVQETGMVGDVKQELSFVDMDLLHQRMLCETGEGGEDGDVTPSDKIHKKMSATEFFKEVGNRQGRKRKKARAQKGKVYNALDCAFPGWGWPAFLRAFFAFTLAFFVTIRGGFAELVERTDIREAAWALISMAGAFSNGHHDAGGRYTYIALLKGIKVWFYVRYNEATLERLATKPKAVAEDLLSEDDATRKGLGECLQPNWWKHFVWTAVDSLTAGKLFDLGDFERVEKCMLEERAVGLLTTNAEREAWYTVLLLIAANMGDHAVKMRVADVAALARMVLNPTAYVPERSEGEDRKLHRLAFWLPVHELALEAEAEARLEAQLDAPARAQARAQAREESMKLWKENGGEDLLPAHHDTRVVQLRRAQRNIRDISKIKNIKQEIILEDY